MFKLEGSNTDMKLCFEQEAHFGIKPKISHFNLINCSMFSSLAALFL